LARGRAFWTYAEKAFRVPPIVRDALPRASRQEHIVMSTKQNRISTKQNRSTAQQEPALVPGGTSNVPPSSAEPTAPPHVDGPHGNREFVQSTITAPLSPSNPAAPPDAGALRVENVTFIVDRLYQDCAPGQFVRELTANGLQWLPPGGGQVIWTIHRPMYEHEQLTKLCCIDTGVGMTGPQLVSHVAGLSKSGRTQSMEENFGVGGRISTVPANPEGVVYLSWVNGQGAMVILKHDRATGRYRLEPFVHPDGSYELWGQVPPEQKPDAIDQHGTVVILLGKTKGEDTTVMPPGLHTPKRWITRYLNGRFFRFPAGADVRVHEGWRLPKGDQHNFLRKISGLEVWLNDPKNRFDSGSVPLNGATAHWWILREDADTNSGHYPTPGVVAALWQNELYDIAVAPAGNIRLQSFGVVFGMKRVVLIVEPDPTEGSLTSNTARTTLLLNSEPLPWTDWAEEFRAQLPAPLRKLMEESAPKTMDPDHRKSLLDRLKGVADLFRFSRYQASRRGTVQADPDSQVSGFANLGEEVVDPPPPPEEPSVNPVTRTRKRGTGGAADYFTQRAAANTAGVQAREVKVPDLPKVYWVSTSDGTRTPDEIEDHAALYIESAHVLKINADFRVFTDMMSRWQRHYAHIPGAGVIVTETVRSWFELQLIEAVLAARALKGSSPHWTSTDVESILTPRALTAVVLPRFHVDQIVGRTLGTRIMSLDRARQFVGAQAAGANPSMSGGPANGEASSD
jgi:hypothetical protein